MADPTFDAATRALDKWRPIAEQQPETSPIVPVNVLAGEALDLACKGAASTASRDWNHDGHTEMEFSALGSSRSRGFGKGCDLTVGWQGSRADCGTHGTWIVNCKELAGNLKTATESKQQRCR